MDVHLGIENTGWCFYHTHGFTESLERVKGSFPILDEGREVQLQILRV